jgi:GntR family transcriptional repressor for pyruvate dehydrogenase complex
VYSKVKPLRLYEQIATQIRNLIFNGTLRLGDQLPSERELAEQFGVSRTAVREAVRVLGEKGLIEIQAGKGTFVTDSFNKMSDVMRDTLGWVVKVSLGNGMLDLVQVRELLEPGIAEIAAEMAKAEEIEIMKKAVAVMDNSMDDADAYVEADLEFHLALAEATQNPIIPMLIDPIVGLLHEQRKRIFKVEGGPQRGQFHHKRILETVMKQDPTAARQAMIAHLEQVRRDSGPALGIED